MAFDLSALQSLLDVSEDDVRRRLQLDNDQGEGGVRYEGLEGLTAFYNPAVLPARVYVRDGRVQMVYVPAGAALAGLTRADLEAQLGGEGVRLASRAGKEYGHFVHADRGVAYSSSKDGVRFVEIFRPRSHAAYMADIYRAPGAFIR